MQKKQDYMLRNFSLYLHHISLYGCAFINNEADLEYAKSNLTKLGISFKVHKRLDIFGWNIDIQ